MYQPGNRMMNTCPKHEGCGKNTPYWTDDEMPDEVGVAKDITIYGVTKDSCKELPEKAEVIRCSQNTKHDFVYRYKGDKRKRCFEAVCGMK